MGSQRAQWADRRAELDSPILEEMALYHQEHYPDVLAEEVARTVRRTVGDVAVAKIADSQKLMRLKVAQEELDETYRSEEALTIS